MKKKWVWLILVVLLVALLAGAGILYPRLSSKTQPVTPGVGTTTTSPTASQAYGSEGSTQTEQDSTAFAPDFTVLNADGSEDMLSLHFGKPIVLNFWATWCGYCVDELPSFDKAAQTYADKVDFMMVDLADGFRETIDSAKAFMQEKGFTFPVYFDTQDSASAAYSVNSIPCTVFIRADGTIYTSYIGNMPEDLLLQYLDDLTAE